MKAKITVTILVPFRRIGIWEKALQPGRYYDNEGPTIKTHQ